MSNLPTTYTPLESLLLFQGLRTAGTIVDSTTFSRISDELKALPLIHNDPSYDAARLNADALRQLYLELLKDEARRDLDQQLTVNGDPPNTRKRKAPSPKLPTVQDATQHSHLIPQLITRLYSRYREITIGKIRDQEQKYSLAVKEIADVKAGKLDDDLQKQAASTQTSPKIPVSSLIQTEDDKADARRPSQTRIDAVINHAPEPTHRRTSSGTVLPPFSEMAARSPKYPATQGYQQPSPTAQTTCYAPHAGSPQLQSAHRSSASPRPTLPPPTAIAGQHPASPRVHSPQMYQPIYAQPQQSAYSRGYQLNQPPHLPTPPGYYQQFPDRRPSYPAQQYPPQAGRGYMQPYNQDPSKLQQLQQRQQPYQQYAQPIYPNAPLTGPRQQVAQHDLSAVLRALTTPTRNPYYKRQQSVSDDPMNWPKSLKAPDFEPCSPVRSPSPVHTTRRAARRKPKRESSIPASESGSRQTRSLSVNSTVNGLIKNETPAAESGDEPATGMTTRRRGTITQTLKRRRDYEPPPRPTTIVATRNLNKMSNTILSDLGSHKHGSRFSKRITDDQAAGYSTFIKRPQDLKSIRAAVNAGAKNTNSIEATPGRSAGPTLEVDRSIEFMPPTAIVNGAQFEKEVMRMFANAVMFNPGEDGMVAATREMFEDMEDKIIQWRATEREQTVGDDEDESRAKRRKL